MDLCPNLANLLSDFVDKIWCKRTLADAVQHILSFNENRCSEGRSYPALLWA